MPLPTFASYFTNFSDMRDKLMFAVGELAQIPQRATNLIPRIDTFINAKDPALQKAGAILKVRATNVRDNSRSEYDKTQVIIKEMMDFKTSVEAHPAFKQMMDKSVTGMLVTLVGRVVLKAEDSKFFQSAVSQAVSLAGKAGTSLVSLERYNAEIKAIEQLAQKTADYAQGKGLLPDISGSPAFLIDIPPAVKKGVVLLGLAAVGGLFYLIKKNRTANQR